MSDEITEAEAFADFIEHREAIMLIAKCRAQGMRVRVDMHPPDDIETLEYMVTLYRHEGVDNQGSRQWEECGNGFGTTLIHAVREAVKESKGPKTQTASAVATGGDFVTSSLSWVKVPNTCVTFTKKRAGQAVISGAIIEDCYLGHGGSNGAIGVAVDGMVVQTIQAHAPNPNGYQYTYNVSHSVMVAAGAHTVELMVIKAKGALGDMRVLCNPSTPAKVDVVW